jgi:hypothetical protein
MSFIRWALRVPRYTLWLPTHQKLPRLWVTVVLVCAKNLLYILYSTSYMDKYWEQEHKYKSIHVGEIRTQGKTYITLFLNNVQTRRYIYMRDDPILYYYTVWLRHARDEPFRLKKTEISKNTENWHFRNAFPFTPNWRKKLKSVNWEHSHAWHADPYWLWPATRKDEISRPMREQTLTPPCTKCRAKSRPSQQGPTWHNRTDAVHIHSNWVDEDCHSWTLLLNTLSSF